MREERKLYLTLSAVIASLRVVLITQQLVNLVSSSRKHWKCLSHEADSLIQMERREECAGGLLYLPIEGALETTLKADSCG